MSTRNRRIVVGVLGVALVLSAVYAASPRLRYRLTGRQRDFNVAVSRAVGRGATLAEMERVVGPARRVDAPSWLKKMMERQPADYPDGLRATDEFVAYTFPFRSTWYFQVRDGRLVNYDPAVLEAQPQEHLTLRGK